MVLSDSRAFPNASRGGLVRLKRVHERSHIRVKLEPLTFSKATSKEMTK
jgi:hypothetical protein